MSGKRQTDPIRSSSEGRDALLIEKQRSRERRKTVGLTILVILIFVLLFLRFGKTIPWAAR